MSARKEESKIDKRIQKMMEQGVPKKLATLLNSLKWSLNELQNAEEMGSNIQQDVYRGKAVRELKSIAKIYKAQISSTRKESSKAKKEGDSDKAEQLNQTKEGLKTQLSKIQTKLSELQGTKKEQHRPVSPKGSSRPG